MAKAIDFSDDSDVPAAVIDPEEGEKLDAFEQVISDAAEGTEKQVDETVEETEAKAGEEVQAAPPLADGPTTAMLAVAEQAGLPADLVATAVNDDQVKSWLTLMEQSRARQDEAPQEGAEFKLSLPEDEFPEDDPVRKEFSNLKSHFSDQIQHLGQQLSEANGKVRVFQEKQGSLEQQQYAKQQRDFDQTLDNTGIAAFGKAAAPTDVSIALRTAAYNLLQERSGRDPDASVAELSQQIAEEFGVPSTKTPQEKAAIRSQTSRRLGGGPSKSATPGVLDPVDGLQSWLDARGITRQ